MEDLIIALETSSPRGSVALFRDKLIASQEFDSTRQVDTTLFPPLNEILAELSGESVQTILVGTGPGSYNGARAGIAAAQALGLSHGARVIGLPSILSIPSVTSGKNCHVIGDARRGEYFCLTCKNGQPAQKLQLLNPDDFRSFLSSSTLPLLAPQPGDTFPLDPKQTIHYELPHAEGLVHYWQNLSEEQKETYLASPVEAYYLRPPHITVSKKGHPLLRKK